MGTSQEQPCPFRESPTSTLWASTWPRTHRPRMRSSPLCPTRTLATSSLWPTSRTSNPWPSPSEIAPPLANVWTSFWKLQRVLSFSLSQLPGLRSHGQLHQRSLQLWRMSGRRWTIYSKPLAHTGISYNPVLRCWGTKTQEQKRGTDFFLTNESVNLTFDHERRLAFFRKAATSIHTITRTGTLKVLLSVVSGESNPEGSRLGVHSDRGLFKVNIYLSNSFVTIILSSNVYEAWPKNFKHLTNLGREEYLSETKPETDSEHGLKVGEYI